MTTTSPINSSRLFRSRIAAIRRRLSNMSTDIDRLADDGGSIILRAETALIDDKAEAAPSDGRRPSWSPSDSVGQGVVAHMTTPVVVTASAIINALNEIERATDELALKVNTADELRLKALAEQPLTDEQRTELIKENADDGDCSVCDRSCTGRRDDRLYQVRVSDTKLMAMCDADRLAWSRRPYSGPGTLESYAEFRARRRSDAGR